MPFLKNNAFHSHPKRSLVSLTPLVDVVFILLIFFMLASNFTQEQVISVLSPHTSQDGGDFARGAVLIRISENGDIDLNGRPISRLELSKQVASWSVLEHPRSYILQIGKGVLLQQAIDILDLVKTAGATSVSLMRQGS